jgi:hypothetical protein
MADNVNIIVQDTINDIVVNAAVIVETIDINVQVAVDEVQIIANPNNYVVNINRIIGEQVQSDWDQADDQAPDYIKNKPTIPTLTSDLTNDGEDGVNPFITAADIPSAVTSIGLTMPSAFTVTNSPITSSGDIAVTGAGVVSQYVRGDGSLANFPTSTGGGASLSFYLNGSVSQGTIGGVAFREMDKTPILGAGTDFTINSNGYIQSFITDANVPNLLEIPAGNWNFETYFSASSNGGSPSFYIELYKWNGTTLSLIASNSATPEGITNGTAIDLYVSALAVPQTTLLATDRLAVRIYVTHSGRTITLHTENSHLCQVITTFSTGLTALNGLTTQVQSFATGTSGTDFGISSATNTHTFNLPTASAANRGALSSTDWTTFNGKFTLPALTSGSVLFSNGTTIAQDNANLFWDDTNNRLGIGTNNPSAYYAKKLVVACPDEDGVTILANTVSSTNYLAFADGVTGNEAFRGYVSYKHLTDQLTFGAAGSLRMTLTSGGNLLLNTTTDAGYRLDVNGTARVSGFVTLSNQLNLPGNNFSGSYKILVNSQPSTGDLVSGTRNCIQDQVRFFNPNSGSSTVYNSFVSSPIINQTNGSTGTTRGLYINPTLTAAADWRAIEVANGGAYINTTSVQASAILQADSTTKGFLPPRMTTTQKNAIATPAAGLVVYDTTLNKLCLYTTAWETITSI